MRTSGRRTATVALLITTLALSGCTPSGTAHPGRVSGALPAPPAPSATTTAPPTLPIGAGTDVPWWEHGVLHVGQARIALARRPELTYAGGTTVVATHGRDGYLHWQVRDGDRLLPLPRAGHSVSIDSVKVSPDGSHLAWIETLASRPLTTEPDNGSFADTTRLVYYDVATHHVVARHPESYDVFCCDAGGVRFVQGITSDDRVILGANSEDHARVWDPRLGDPRPMPGVAAAKVAFEGSWPGGVMFASGEDVAEFASVSGDGTIIRRGRVGDPDDASLTLWSPDGRYYAWSDGPGTVEGPAGTRPLPTVDLPVAVWTPVAWESDNDLILQRGTGGHGGLTRCSVVTRACETVADGPGRGAVVPGGF